MWNHAKKSMKQFNRPTSLTSHWFSDFLIYDTLEQKFRVVWDLIITKKYIIVLCYFSFHSDTELWAHSILVKKLKGLSRHGCFCWQWQFWLPHWQQSGKRVYQACEAWQEVIWLSHRATKQARAWCFSPASQTSVILGGAFRLIAHTGGRESKGARPKLVLIVLMNWADE